MLHFIDSHIHLQDYKVKDTPQLIFELQKCGVIQMVCPSTSEKDWPTVETIVKSSSQNVIAAYGIHPWQVGTQSTFWQDKLYSKLIADPNAWIGECGLDKHRNPYFEEQAKIFTAHINMAKELQRPLIIHAVKANQWLEDFWSQLHAINFVIHSFSGDESFLHRVLKFGGYISFSPSVLHKKTTEKLVASIPLNRLLVESDGPYQGESCNIVEIIKLVSQIRNIEIEKLAFLLMDNFREFTRGR